MNALPPLESWFDATSGSELPLPPALAALYGPLRFPIHPDRPHVIANLVTTLDGVVSLGNAGKASGRQISGDNPHDRLVMGVLRAAADAVIVGAGTFRASARRRWTAETAYPPLAAAFRELRHSLGKPESPLNVVVTAGRDLDLTPPPDDLTGVPLLVVTTDDGARVLRSRRPPATVEIAHGPGPLTAARVLALMDGVHAGKLILVEGGPRLMSSFVAGGCLDEFFVTIAPQIAGRDGTLPRPGLVTGASFAPDDPRWARLVALKRAGSHLFTRYALASAPPGESFRGKEHQP